MVRAVGLDVHLEFCEVAIAEGGKVRSAGRIPSTQPRSFGTIPPPTRGAASTSATVAREIRDPGSSGSASQPSTSVRKISLWRAELGRDLARRLVGVDVVGAALAVDCRPTRSPG